jgi:hypothetical protein
MAEMMVCMEDRISPDIESTSKQPQRGDVIRVMADGWNWGAAERAAPFTIVVVPDAAPEDLAVFIFPEAPLEIGMEWWSLSNTLQFRGFKVDVDSYTGGVLRAGEGATVPFDEVMALKVKKDPLPDPKRVGGSDNVIG